jgi:predicted secreted hydrolase
VRVRFNKALYAIVFIAFIRSISGCSDEPVPLADDAQAHRGLAALLGSGGEAGFEEALSPREFSFPADHGPHPGFRNEWWYLSGNLDSADGRRFGYELTLFRFRLAPDAVVESAPDWASRQVFVGHFALTDVAEGRFHVAERYARGAAGLAGAGGSPLKIWLYDWSIRQRRTAPGNGWQLTAADGNAASGGISLALTLTPEKDPVPHGDRGLSRKSREPGNASYYYSVPRLRTSGNLRIGKDSHEVEGQSWLDREWSSSALGAEQQGWDWFSLQLSDGSDLMFYQLRTRQGARDPHSAGTWMAEDEPPAHLASDDVQLEVLDYWDSPAGGRYPIDWRLIVPAEHLDLRIRPVLENQELDTWVRYWEGAVDVSGTRGATRVSGRGYVELTGYDEP